MDSRSHLQKQVNVNDLIRTSAWSALEVKAADPLFITKVEDVAQFISLAGANRQWKILSLLVEHNPSLKINLNVIIPSELGHPYPGATIGWLLALDNNQDNLFNKIVSRAPETSINLQASAIYQSRSYTVLDFFVKNRKKDLLMTCLNKATNQMIQHAIITTIKCVDWEMFDEILLSLPDARFSPRATIGDDTYSLSGSLAFERQWERLTALKAHFSEEMEYLEEIPDPDDENRIIKVYELMVRDELKWGFDETAQVVLEAARKKQMVDLKKLIDICKNIKLKSEEEVLKLTNLAEATTKEIFDSFKEMIAQSVNRLLQELSYETPNDWEKVKNVALAIKELGAAPFQAFNEARGYYPGYFTLILAFNNQWELLKFFLDLNPTTPCNLNYKVTSLTDKNFGISLAWQLLYAGQDELFETLLAKQTTPVDLNPGPLAKDHLQRTVSLRKLLIERENFDLLLRLLGDTPTDIEIEKTVILTVANKKWELLDRLLVQYPHFKISARAKVPSPNGIFGLATYLAENKQMKRLKTIRSRFNDIIEHKEMLDSNLALSQLTQLIIQKDWLSLKKFLTQSSTPEKIYSMMEIGDSYLAFVLVEEGQIEILRMLRPRFAGSLSWTRKFNVKGQMGTLLDLWNEKKLIKSAIEEQEIDAQRKIDRIIEKFSSNNQAQIKRAEKDLKEMFSELKFITEAQETELVLRLLEQHKWLSLRRVLSSRTVPFFIPSQYLFSGPHYRGIFILTLALNNEWECLARILERKAEGWMCLNDRVGLDSDNNFGISLAWHLVFAEQFELFEKILERRISEKSLKKETFLVDLNNAPNKESHPYHGISVGQWLIGGRRFDLLMKLLGDTPSKADVETMIAFAAIKKEWEFMDRLLQQYPQIKISPTIEVAKTRINLLDYLTSQHQWDMLAKLSKVTDFPELFEKVKDEVSLKPVEVNVTLEPENKVVRSPASACESDKGISSNASMRIFVPLAKTSAPYDSAALRVLILEKLNSNDSVKIIIDDNVNTVQVKIYPKYRQKDFVEKIEAFLQKNNQEDNIIDCSIITDVYKNPIGISFSGSVEKLTNMFLDATTDTFKLPPSKGDLSGETKKELSKEASDAWIAALQNTTCQSKEVIEIEWNLHEKVASSHFKLTCLSDDENIKNNALKRIWRYFKDSTGLKVGKGDDWGVICIYPNGENQTGFDLSKVRDDILKPQPRTKKDDEEKKSEPLPTQLVALKPPFDAARAMFKDIMIGHDGSFGYLKQEITKDAKHSTQEGKKKKKKKALEQEVPTKKKGFENPDSKLRFSFRKDRAVQHGVIQQFQALENVMKDIQPGFLAFYQDVKPKIKDGINKDVKECHIIISARTEQDFDFAKGKDSLEVLREKYSEALKALEEKRQKELEAKKQEISTSTAEICDEPATPARTPSPPVADIQKEKSKNISYDSFGLGEQEYYLVGKHLKRLQTINDQFLADQNKEHYWYYHQAYLFNVMRLFVVLSKSKYETQGKLFGGMFYNLRSDIRHRVKPDMEKLILMMQPLLEVLTKLKDNYVQYEKPSENSMTAIYNAKKFISLLNELTGKFEELPFLRLDESKRESAKARKERRSMRAAPIHECIRYLSKSVHPPLDKKIIDEAMIMGRVIVGERDRILPEVFEQRRAMAKEEEVKKAIGIESMPSEVIEATHTANGKIFYRAGHIIPAPIRSEGKVSVSKFSVFKKGLLDLATEPSATTTASLGLKNRAGQCQ